MLGRSFYCEYDEALELVAVAQGCYACPIPTSVQGQVGWGPE